MESPHPMPAIIANAPRESPALINRVPSMNVGLADPAIHWSNRSPPPKMANAKIAMMTLIRIDIWRTRCATDDLLMASRQSPCAYYCFMSRLTHFLRRARFLQPNFTSSGASDCCGVSDGGRVSRSQTVAPEGRIAHPDPGSRLIPSLAANASPAANSENPITTEVSPAARQGGADQAPRSLRRRR